MEHFMCAANSEHEQVQADVRPRCLYNEETGYFGLPSPEQLATYHIVVCTCGAAGNHFTPALFDIGRTLYQDHLL